MLTLRVQHLLNEETNCKEMLKTDQNITKQWFEPMIVV